MPQLLVDNGSLYTGRLHSALFDLGCDPDRASPAAAAAGKLSAYDSFVLSGRRTNDKNTNKINSKIIAHAIATSMPLLGVCYGAEMIALSCGGTIRRMAAPRQGLYTVTPTGDDTICSSPISVFESHRYEISTLPSTLESIASSAECANEIIRVTGSSIYGTQFHPEMSSDGLGTLAMFSRLCLTP